MTGGLEKPINGPIKAATTVLMTELTINALFVTQSILSRGSLAALSWYLVELPVLAVKRVSILQTQALQSGRTNRTASGEAGHR